MKQQALPSLFVCVQKKTCNSKTNFGCFSNINRSADLKKKRNDRQSLQKSWYQSIIFYL